MDLEEMIKQYDGPPKCRVHFRDDEYAENYETVKKFVLSGRPLRAAVKILQKNGHFEDKRTDSVWQNFRRALEIEGIKLKEKGNDDE